MIVEILELAIRWDRDGTGVGIRLGDSGAYVLYGAVGVDVG